MHGSLILEVLIALSIAVVVFSSFLFMQGNFFKTKRDGLIKMQAAYYAGEAMEAIRRIRDDSSRGFNGANGLVSFATSDVTPNRFIPSLSTGDWLLVAYSSGAHDALYNPKDGYQVGVYFYTVSRNASGSIISGGGSDPNTRRVVIRVCWVTVNCQSSAPGGANEVVVESYFTGWKN
ncbi:MAG: hypothetical protein EXS68_01445 [Candidatus Ryanbacteria bacterium]|nr:hypothetical protein [Candidatus Ryanbacteria bacterium]